MTREELEAVMSRPGFGSGRRFLAQKQQEADALALLPDPAQMAPLMVSTDIGNGWPVCSFGHYDDEGTGESADYHIVTDHVRASETLDLTLPGDAKNDAHMVCAILNAYRMGLLVKCEKKS